MTDRDKTTTMVEIIDSEIRLNILLSEDGHRVWVCTDYQGTVLRAKVKSISLDDRRIVRESEND